jgi:D-tyrosyl-tRNA(Tyr) deacylase
VRAVVQRVSRARVLVRDDAPIATETVASETVAGEIGSGLLVLLGVARGDDEHGVEQLAQRIAQLRCFADAQGRMNLDVQQAVGALLVVSQFTLVADLARGRRPSFDDAEAPARARELVEHFVTVARGLGLRVETGRFGAHMRVELENDGPVTFVIDGGSAAPAGSGTANPR